jgi:hypothetical protein
MKYLRLRLSIVAVFLMASVMLSACGGNKAIFIDQYSASLEEASAPLAVSRASIAQNSDALSESSTKDLEAKTSVASDENYLADIGFRPETNGFSFQNYGGGNYVNLTPEDMNRIYGDAVCANKADGTCNLTPPADQWMKQTNDAMTGGHCYGMAQASLLFYKNALDPADFNGATITDFKLEGNEKLQREIAFDWSGQKLDQVRKGVISGTPNDVLDKLIEIYNSGPDAEVYVAGFFKSDGTGGHAVTPYAVKDLGDGTNALMIYDNNYPGIPREMIFDRKANSWSYEASINPSVASELYQGDANSQSFFVFPVSPAIQQSECSFCTGGITTNKVETEPNKVEATPAKEETTPNKVEATPNKQQEEVIEAVSINEIYLDGLADLLMTDVNGKKLGRENGKIVNEIPGAKYEIPMAAFDSDIEPVYSVPSDIDLTIAIDGSRLKEDALTDVVIIGPGYDLGVEGITLSPGQKDELILQPKESFISYRTDSSESPIFIIGLQREGADYQFAFTGTDMEGGGRISMMVDTKTGDLMINAGELKKDGMFALAMTRIDETTEETFTNEEIALKADSILFIDFAEWKGNGTPVNMGIDINGDGEIDEAYSSSDAQ